MRVNTRAPRCPSVPPETGAVAAWPCYLVNRVILWACMLPDKACGQLVVGRRVDLKMPTVTVQYSSLGVNATVHIGSRALPSVWNFYRNTVEARPWPHVCLYASHPSLQALCTPSWHQMVRLHS